MDLLLRFIIGGTIVSLFALLSDSLRPKSFAGLFGAAPSVALATLGLTFAKEGADYVAVAGRSMLLGAVALLVYTQLVSWLLRRYTLPSLLAGSLSLTAWFGVALGLWWLILR